MGPYTKMAIENRDSACHNGLVFDAPSVPEQVGGGCSRGGCVFGEMDVERATGCT
jgi:hypothetical protein